MPIEVFSIERKNPVLSQSCALFPAAHRMVGGLAPENPTMVDFQGSHFEWEIVLRGRALVFGVSDQLPPARRDDGRTRREGRLFQSQSLGDQVWPLLDRTFRERKRRVGGSWRKDETYVRIRGR
jgi:hypothetical protein